MTIRHKDIRYATKTSNYATKTLVIPQRHQLSHEDTSYATKTSICHKDYDIWVGNYWVIICYSPRVKA